VKETVNVRRLRARFAQDLPKFAQDRPRKARSAKKGVLPIFKIPEGAFGLRESLDEDDDPDGEVTFRTLEMSGKDPIYR